MVSGFVIAQIMKTEGVKSFYSGARAEILVCALSFPSLLSTLSPAKGTSSIHPPTTDGGQSCRSRGFAAPFRMSPKAGLLKPANRKQKGHFRSLLRT
ncbi:ADP,ATP carrier protein, mitochondrial-like [Gossypium australe]|uniref:ADP,ATP carrier protein, mitochondrial-like n=1 Tax=Gossypium australe TaxID=47621 RepID=A0A5B6WAR7_9ROSI|nr:ADP,ATP carrier protein, mitochondrial-like [Gossypium australe]